jgi:anti-anti-sigma factor
VAGSDHLSVELRHEAGVVVVRLEGELDLASVPVLERELERAEVGDAAKVVLDLRDLRFIDSTGLRTIFTAHARAQERGREFAVTRGPEQVQRLLAITRLGERLRVVDAPEQTGS